MAAQALYLRWRPQTFDDVVGQDHITYTLRNALVSGRIGHAYLFSGPRGTGKTTMARLLAKAVNCLAEDPALRPCNECAHCVAVNEGRFLDLIEIDAASHTGVDDVRELRDRIAFSPNEGQYKVYIIDEVHRFSGAAFDALLKTIEEPPAHALFALATTEIHKVPQTILSRCQRFDFRRIPLWQIVERLRLIVEQEGLQAEDAALELVARQATGSLRDAISLLDQLIMGTGELLTLELAQAVLGTAASQSVIDLTGAILAGDAASGLDIVNQTLDAGADPRQFSRQMVEYLRLVMLVQTGGPQLADTLVPAETLAVVTEQAAQFPKRTLLAALNAFNTAASDTHSGWQPQLPLEMALIESVEALYPTEEPRPAAAPAAPARPAPAPAAPAPAPAAVEEGAPPTPASTASFTLPQVRERWRDVLRAVHQADLTVEALLKSGTLYAVEQDVVLYQMPSEILRDKMDSEPNREVVEQAMQRVFGETLQFRCRSETAATGGQSGQVEDLLAGDSVISFAVNELGGSVKNVEENEE